MKNELLSIQLEIGRSFDNSEFIEIEIPKKVQNKINKMLIKNEKKNKKS